MKTIKHFIRIAHIQIILARNGFDSFLYSFGFLSSLRFMAYLNPWNWRRTKRATRGQALRRSLEQLGPIFVKFGQALSTRPDILPGDIALELNQLQDKVPPFPSTQVLSILEKTYGCSPYELFSEFDSQALASASIAQVHAAVLKTGEHVVVKILRPNLQRLIKQDLSILKTWARWAQRYWPQSRRYKPEEIVREFESTLMDELDLNREAANAAQLRRNFENSPLLYVPQIYWDYCHHNVLVMERIHGIPVSDVPTLRAQGVNLKKLAERGVEIFFLQVFRDCFFHADMHPGNIFVSDRHPEAPQYICVDFGIMGTLSTQDKRYLAENLLAFFKRDYRRVAELHIESGWVPANTRMDQFESAIRTVCEPAFERPLKDISFAYLILHLFHVARRFNMQVQPQLLLLQKTLFAVEGLGRQLYPELDLWSTAKPFLEQWMSEQIGPKAFLKGLKENAPFFMEQLPYLPQLFFEVLEKKKEHLVHFENPQNSNSILPKSSFMGSVATASFLLIALFNLAHPLNSSQLTTILLIGAGIMGLLHLISRP